MRLNISSEDIGIDYQNGASSSELAKKYSTSKKTILRRLKEANVKTRTISTACRVHSLDENFFCHVNTEEKAYWLGFLLADGNIGTGGRFQKARILRVALQRRDESHLEKLRHDLKSNHRLKQDDTHHCTWLCIASRPLTQPLENMGWHEFKKSGELRILTHVPPPMTRHLIRGLIDGDGCIQHHANRWSLGFTDLHQSVVEWVIEQITLAGFHSKARSYLPKGHRNWCVIYNGNKLVPPMLRWLYADCTTYLNRKRELAIQSFC